MQEISITVADVGYESNKYYDRVPSDEKSYISQLSLVDRCARKMCARSRCRRNVHMFRACSVRNMALAGSFFTATLPIKIQHAASAFCELLQV